MRMQQSVYLITELFYVYVNNTNVMRSSCKVTDCFSDFNQIWIFQTDFSKSIRYKCKKIPPIVSRADTCGGTGGYDEAQRPSTKAPNLSYESFPAKILYGRLLKRSLQGTAFRLR